MNIGPEHGYIVVYWKLIFQAPFGTVDSLEGAPKIE
jgi:hypothetical protein